MFRRGGRISSSKRRALIVLPVWLWCVYWMWSWWISSERINFLPLFIPLTLAMLYEFVVLPSTFIFFVLRSKMPPRRIAPKNLKVAMISLCVPSKESLDIVEKQLKAMAAVKYPHDTWILDEGNSLEVRNIADQYGVNYFSRKGRRKYNQQGPPFKKQTKAGNVNAWLDHVRDRGYEFFVQLDIDHLPKPNYLHKTLGFFRDKEVAWVQAPSVYKNLDTWTARGAAEQELTLQGPLQMGFYGYSETPFIIGSHSTYRMSAIKEIGGFQPTRAEDHLDTVALASRGYKGIFLPEIIAEGDGPETLATYLAQQYAWAYSMFQVLTGYSARLMKNMSLKKRFQFLFAQTWYPFWSLSYALMFITPAAALLLQRDVGKLRPEELLIRFMPTFLCGFLIWWAARPIMQPRGMYISWRGMILHAVRWPIILKAICSCLFRITKPYMITPKGQFARVSPQLRTYRPFLLLGLISAAALAYSSYKHDSVPLTGQFVFAFTNAIFMLTICLVDLSLRFKDADLPFFHVPRGWRGPVIAVMALAVLLAGIVTTSPIIDEGKVAAYLYPASSSNLISAASGNTQAMTTEQLIAELRSLPRKNTVNLLPRTGIYQPGGTRIPASEPYIQHIFADWNEPESLAKQLLNCYRAGNTPLITLEPRGELDGGLLLSGIPEGRYDKQLRNVTDIIGAANRPAYVRFAHEMELAQLYPWGNQDSAKFIAAYRYAINYMRSNGAEKTISVWSPAGNIGSGAYYPGSEMVDIIGTTVLYDEYFYGGYKPTFSELTRQRKVELQQYGKPIWIVEFGVGKKDMTFQNELIHKGVAEFQRLGFDAIVYLNIVDSNIVGPDYTIGSPGLERAFAKPLLLTPLLNKVTEEPRSFYLDDLFEQKRAVMPFSSTPTPLIR